MEDATIIAFILAVISFLGVVFNWTVVIANRQITTSKHSFGILTANQALGDALYSTIFLFYVCPMIHFVTNTYRLASVVNITSLSLTFVDYYVGCSLNWYSELFLFNFPSTTFCQIVAFYADFCKYLVFILLVIIIDVATVFRVHQLRNRIQSSTTVSDKKAAAQRAREMSFLKQTCVQGGIFTCELITYFILSPMIENAWILFFCTSFAWVSVHSLDG
ncbi:hypothetical protein CRE_27442 [Caenorhabditis remanei]|uniref:7TM GPCR serpentine receptor class x (Srx) domain-containing protein n=1 Tax=Caenorhabditis remanei TaxID=31234 RepID=E3LNM8_CAERE|nr:hypothetical protein CRE_27442 [Caenorhabditis remanei]